MTLVQVQVRIRQILLGEPYGLWASQIKNKADLSLSTVLIGHICYRDSNIERVNSSKTRGRWRLKKVR